MQYYAHSKEGSPESEWQTIEEHTQGVAGLSRKFAARFDVPNWGYAVGLLHDLGKYKPEFQDRLRGKRARVDHATAGGLWAKEHVKPPAFGRVLAYCIVGHHTGIPDGTSGTDDTCLNRRLENGSTPKECPELTIPPLEIPPFVRDALHCGRDLPSGFGATFFVRMLFSALKDGDCLDTEAFLEPDKSALRGDYPNLQRLKWKFDEYMQRRFSDCDRSELNSLRDEVRQQCIEKACEAPGLFSLTVPTGGGKTLSSMAFALEHALQHDLERIIYVIPYTSIIEQTAREFKVIFGGENVIEHHSNYASPTDSNESQEELETKRLLATENWDAPIIVTTNVQFFESLFHNKTAKLRRIHNIVRSVVILDEAQMLPVPFLLPTIQAIRELADRYHVSLVLCTATQPALNDSELKGGLSGVREIVDDPRALEERLQRVRTSHVGALSDEELANALRAEERVLCIVNRRADARRLYELIGDRDGHYHLSALMCAEHRTRVFEKVRARLAKSHVCRVVSTQLVEAGVDIDFPVVFRAIAGLDSIVQSAGRCNRENHIGEGGKLFVFQPETGVPRGAFKQAAEITNKLLEKYDEDMLSAEAVRDYFNELYWVKSLGNSLDEKRIVEDCRLGEVALDFPFRTIAEKYRLIDDVMESIIVPYDDHARTAIDELRVNGPSGNLLRRLQRYIVGVYPSQFIFLRREGIIETLFDSFHVMNEFSFEHAYSDSFGLNPDCQEFCDPERLFV